MAYYMGDYYGPGGYYAGDYYRGDPGIFGKIGGFFRGVARGVGRVAGRVAGIAGRVGRVAVGAAGGPLGLGLAALPVPGTRTLPTLARRAWPVVRDIGKGIVTGVGASEIAKSIDLWPFGHKKRRRRRMNPANPRALRRALRRVSGFGKLARRTRRDVARAASAVGVRHRAARKARR
jgi:hypothetical protein